jgi:hypothetical protein
MRPEDLLMNAPSSKDPFAFDEPAEAGGRRWLPWLLGVLLIALIGGAWYFWKASSTPAARSTVTPAPKAGLPPPATAAGGAASGGSGAAADGMRGAAGPAAGSGPVGPSLQGATDISRDATGGAASSSSMGTVAASGQIGANAVGTAGPRYPIERSLGGTGPIDPGTTTLDPPAADKAISNALAAMPGREQILRFALPSEVVRRVVLTIDNLPGDSMSMQYRAVNTIGGPIVIERKASAIFLSADNARRYEEFVKMASNLDSRRLVGLYKRFYPLFQQEYSAIGYPDRHFNDRVVEAIDDLLATPTPQGPIELIQPRVLHEYADPGLERRSVGQRMMLRLGPENANRLKAKLREIRAALTNETR